MEADVKIKQRDAALDIAKGILIVLMLIGHMEIPNWLREIIYSFHMPAFIFFSGYCFKPKVCKNIKGAIMNLAKTFLLPYAIWGLFYIVMSHEGIVSEIKNIIFGMSVSNKFFGERTSVGQVYFLLLLFVVRLIYIFIYKYIENELIKTLIVILISLFGYFLGTIGFYFPWSLDCALYSSIYYHIGYCMKERKLISIVQKHKVNYLILFVIWGCLIWTGGMELITREYGNYVLTIGGAICATIILYLLCSLLDKYLPKFLKNGLTVIGGNTLYILLVHTILGGYITLFVAKSLIAEKITDIVLVIIYQVLIGSLAGVIIKRIGSFKDNRGVA